MPSSWSTCATRSRLRQPFDDTLAADGTAVAVRADIGDQLDVERLLDESAAAFGGVDLVAHAAVDGIAEVNRQAARRLRTGGTIFDASGTDHEVADVVVLLDRWPARSERVRALSAARPGRMNSPQPPRGDGGIRVVPFTSGISIATSSR